MKKSLILFILTLFITGSLFAQYRSYRIQKGESLSDLAQKFDVTKAAILKLNPDLKKGKLTNKVIVVPPSETDENTPEATVVRFKEYRVKPKETLYSLAKRNDISIKDIKRFNPYLYEEELGANDLIRIPIFHDGYPNFNASVQNSTFKNLMHVVMPKETKWGISQKYGMTVEELNALNPLVKVLHPGQVLKVNNPIYKTNEVGEYRYYEVKPKETFYSLTRRLDISKDSLEKLNPVLKELGLQAGMQLKIPIKSSSYANIGMASSNLLDLTQHLHNFSPKNVVIMLPFNLQKIAASNKREALKNDKILQISLDLYAGIEMAIDSAKSFGIPVNVRVFDTQQSSSKINSILNQTDFKQTDFIIGPLLAKNIQTVAQHLKHQDIAILSPLTNNNLYGSDKIIQTRPLSVVKEKVLLAYLKQHHSGKNLIILADEEHRNFKEKLTATFPAARVVHKVNSEYLTKRDLTKLMDNHKPNWVIMITDVHGDIINAVSYLNSVHSQYDVRLFTSDKNKSYEEVVTSTYYSHLNFTYTSVNKSGVDQENNAFIEAYTNKYGITPNSYVIRGFDIAFDALLRSAAAPDIFKSIKETKEKTTGYVGNRFHYQKKNAGGYYNNAVYLIKYENNLNLKTLN